MSDPKYTKPWHGIPRNEIHWNPTVHEEACIGCGTCVTGCNRLVYRYDFKRQKAVVADPLNCLVGCTTCANTCPTSAISFPPLESILKLEKTAAVHHAIEDDLLARRNQLEIERNIPGAERTVTLILKSIQTEGPRTKILTLAPKTQADCMCVFVPGQYIELFVPGTPWLGRAYSIGNAPRPDGSIELQIRLTPEGRLTQWLANDARVGAEVTVRGPVGHFTIRSAPDTPLAFLAAGTAFAPIKALIEQQLELFPKRDIVLIWGARSHEDFYELETLKKWSEMGVKVYLSTSEDRKVEKPPARLSILQGTLADAVRAQKLNWPDRDTYLAGPREAIVTTRKALVEQGASPERVFVDSFGA